MSSPLPALNPVRPHDHPIAATPVVPLVRRAQQESGVPTREFPDDAAPPEESADTAHDQEAHVPTTQDGNLFATVGITAVPLLAKGPGGEDHMQAAASSGHGDAARAQAGSLASPRRTTSMASPVMPQAAMDASALQVQRRHVLSDHAGGLSGPLSPKADGAVTTMPALAVAADVVDAVLPTAPVIDGDDYAPPVHGPRTDAPTVRTADNPSASHREHRRTVPDGSAQLLPASGPPYAQTQAHGADLRGHGTSAGGAKAAVAVPELPAVSSVQRMTTVSVPFSSWGLGHQVTASWIPTRVSGLPLPPVTLRSSSESAQRAVGSALAADDRSALGDLQIIAVDSADDGTSERRGARYAPEDDE